MMMNCERTEDAPNRLACNAAVDVLANARRLTEVWVDAPGEGSAPFGDAARTHKPSLSDDDYMSPTVADSAKTLLVV
jgi:hypothetical protein